MVTRNIMVSDLSGETNASTFKLGTAGTWYEVDLTGKEQQELSGLLRTYLDAGRKVAGPSSRRLVPVTTAEERVRIREWARQQGYEVAPRGVIPMRAFRAYVAAHEGQAS